MTLTHTALQDAHFAKQAQQRLFLRGTRVQVARRLAHRPHPTQPAYEPLQRVPVDAVGRYIMPSRVVFYYDPASNREPEAHTHLVEDESGRLRHVLAQDIHCIDLIIEDPTMTAGVDDQPAAPQQLAITHNILTDRAVQVRVDGLDNAKVDQYRLAMQEGATFPPIVVFKAEPLPINTIDGPAEVDHGKVYVGDGFHRLAAARQAGLKTILAEVRPGGLDAAQEYAEEANLAHGLELTHQDKRHIFERRLKRGHDWAQWSNRRLAAVLGVSESTIRNWRDDLTAQNCAVAPDVRIGIDGRTMDVSGIQDAHRSETAPAGEDSTDSVPGDVSLPALNADHVDQLLRAVGQHCQSYPTLKIVTRAWLQQETHLSPDEVDRAGQELVRQGVLTQATASANYRLADITLLDLDGDSTDITSANASFEDSAYSGSETITLIGDIKTTLHEHGSLDLINLRLENKKRTGRQYDPLFVVQTLDGLVANSTITRTQGRFAVEYALPDQADTAESKESDESAPPPSEPNDTPAAPSAPTADASIRVDTVKEFIIDALRGSQRPLGRGELRTAAHMPTLDVFNEALRQLMANQVVAEQINGGRRQYHFVEVIHKPTEDPDRTAYNEAIGIENRLLEGALDLQRGLRAVMAIKGIRSLHALGADRLQRDRETLTDLQASLKDSIKLMQHVKSLVGKIDEMIATGQPYD